MLSDAVTLMLGASGLIFRLLLSCSCEVPSVASFWSSRRREVPSLSPMSRQWMQISLRFFICIYLDGCTVLDWLIGYVTRQWRQWWQWKCFSIFSASLTGGPSLECDSVIKLDSVNCLKMVQNIKIKMTYLIVVVFLCVLDVSGAFQAIF